MAVVAALELHNGVATRKAARQADRAHGRFGARTHEAHQFQGRHELDHAARELRLEFSRRAEGKAVGGDLLDGLDHLRMRMAQDHRTPGADVIDEAASIGGRHHGAGGFLEENRLAADAAEGANGRVDAARDVFAGFLVQVHPRDSKQPGRPSAS